MYWGSIAPSMSTAHNCSVAFGITPPKQGMRLTVGFLAHYCAVLPDTQYGSPAAVCCAMMSSAPPRNGCLAASQAPAHYAHA